ncbi:collagen-like protein [Chitinophaga silvatica]|uniref:Collagen-like protein n=1 Tax=Chitinophaga silvatica TaxID=2282649 RepID=A0A3E1Y6V2_9BACT|nr:collagen-like protein [Chitinophaga silvatica]RFS20674.1 collagen-like protein [Chitinophaga silvatica]
MSKILNCILLLSTVILFASCSKEGPVGPAGPTGATGPTGAQGNSNVTSGNFTLTNASYVNDYWSYQTAPGSASAVVAKMATQNIAGITNNIFNSGTVLLYIKLPSAFGGNPSTWTPMPWQIASFYTGYLIYMNYTYDVGKLRVYYMYLATDHAPSTPIPSVTTATVTSFDFKYVIIAGNAGARQAAPPVDYNNYEAVKKYYNLAD